MAHLLSKKWEIIKNIIRSGSKRSGPFIIKKSGTSHWYIKLREVDHLLSKKWDFTLVHQINY
jgi:hypothetical protein